MSTSTSKTALQELIDDIAKYKEDGHKDLPIGLVQRLLEMALAKEREQIIEAYYGGTAQFDNAASIVYPKTPEDYFTQTYNTQPLNK